MLSVICFCRAETATVQGSRRVQARKCGPVLECRFFRPLSSCEELALLLEKTLVEKLTLWVSSELYIGLLVCLRLMSFS